MAQYLAYDDSDAPMFLTGSKDAVEEWESKHPDYRYVAYNSLDKEETLDLIEEIA